MRTPSFGGSGGTSRTLHRRLRWCLAQIKYESPHRSPHPDLKPRWVARIEEEAESLAKEPTRPPVPVPLAREHWQGPSACPPFDLEPDEVPGPGEALDLPKILTSGPRSVWAGRGPSRGPTPEAGTAPGLRIGRISTRGIAIQPGNPTGDGTRASREFPESINLANQARSCRLRVVLGGRPTVCLKSTRTDSRDPSWFPVKGGGMKPIGVRNEANRAFWVEKVGSRRGLARATRVGLLPIMSSRHDPYFFLKLRNSARTESRTDISPISDGYRATIRRQYRRRGGATRPGPVRPTPRPRRTRSPRSFNA